MSQVLESPSEFFVDRRSYGESSSQAVRERRQFSNSYADLSLAAQELAVAIDEYKLMHRRRFINYEEMLGVVVSLGYRKDEA